jgi:hypothetical protein
MINAQPEEGMPWNVGNFSRFHVVATNVLWFLAVSSAIDDPFISFLLVSVGFAEFSDEDFMLLRVAKDKVKVHR